MAGSGAAKVTGLEWVVLGAGLVAYISSYLPWYTTSVSILSIDSTARMNAWNAGFGAWFSVLLLVAAAGLVLLSAVSGRLRLPTSGPLIMLTLSVLAFVTIVLRWVTFPDATGGLGTRELGSRELGRLGELGDVDLGSAFTASSGAGAGLYLGLIAAIAAVVASFLTFRAADRNL